MMPHRLVAAPIAWEDQYKVGVAAIDRDHEDLFRVYNEIVLNLTTASDARIKERIVATLEGYTKNHFKVEEELMRAVGYPNYHTHQAAHESFCEYIEDLATAFANDEETSSDFIHFLGNWILSHVLVMDQEIAEYLWADGENSERTD
jgi:hemerythrin